MRVLIIEIQMNSALSIFIIDDDPVFQIVLNAGISLADLPKEVTTFNNGREALDHLDGQKGISGQVLIFLDINMPVLDGWQFLDALQNKAYQKQIAVVMTSTSTLVEDKVRALRYPQVLFYQEKPIKLTAVKSLLEEIFENQLVRR